MKDIFSNTSCPFRNYPGKYSPEIFFKELNGKVFKRPIRNGELKKLKCEEEKI
jgi:hypothetical protein